MEIGLYFNSPSWRNEFLQSSFGTANIFKSACHLSIHFPSFCQLYLHAQQLALNWLSKAPIGNRPLLFAKAGWEKCLFFSQLLSPILFLDGMPMRRFAFSNSEFLQPCLLSQHINGSAHRMAVLLYSSPVPCVGVLWGRLSFVVLLHKISILILNPVKIWGFRSRERTTWGVSSREGDVSITSATGTPRVNSCGGGVVGEAQEAEQGEEMHLDVDKLCT